MLCLFHYGPTLLRFWFQTDLRRENSASYLTFIWPFLTMVTRWSRSTSNLYALIGQNLKGEFMRKMYAASWNLSSLTAEADRVLCQLVMFLTSVIHGWFVYWVFGWEMRRLSKSEIRFRMASFSFFTLLENSEAILALLDTFQELHLEW